MQAEYIAVDRSALDVSERYSVALDSGAQANARAMAIVNAAGGLIANNINVSHINGNTLSTPVVNVVQRNVIDQRR